MIGETGERKSAVATPDGKSRKKKKKKHSFRLLIHAFSTIVVQINFVLKLLNSQRDVYTCFVHASLYTLYVFVCLVI